MSRSIWDHKKRSIRTCVICGAIFSISEDSKQMCCSKPCSHERDIRAKRARYHSDPKSANERTKAYYAENKEKVKAYIKQWQVDNPERVKQYQLTQASKEETKLKRKVYYKAHRQEIIDRMTVWRKANPERYNAATRKAKHKADFNGLRDAVMVLVDHKCQKCGTPDDLHVHHIDGDKKNNFLENFLVVCRTCHGKEHIGKLNLLNGPETQKARRRLRASGIYKMAMEEAGGKCSICQTTEKLAVHHVDGNTGNNSIENLIVYCSKCHILHHRNGNN